MYEVKVGVIRPLPLRLYDSVTTLPKSGVIFSEVTCAIWKADKSVVTFSPAVGDWQEVTTGAFAGKGFYSIALPAGSLDVLGPLAFAIEVAGTTGYVGSVKVGADASEIQSTAAAIQGDTATIITTTTRTLDICEGRWKIDKPSKQMIFYKLDGVTEVQRYNLFNDLGLPDADVVFDRVPA